MGGTHSAPDYEGDLLSDSKSQAERIGDETEEDTKVEHSCIYRALGHKEGFIDEITYEGEHKGTARTLFDVLDFAGNAFADKKCFGTQVHVEGSTDRGDYVWMDYKTFREKAHAYGRGIKDICELKSDDNCGVFAINRVEWSISSWGHATQSFRTVALYDTLGPEATAFILEHAELKVISCSKDKLAKVFQAKKDNPELELQFVIQYDPDDIWNNKDENLTDEDKASAEALGMQLLAFSEVLQRGFSNVDDLPPTPPSPEDLAFIMYTSGTTGMPKGVQLSHRNLIATAAGAMKVFPIMADDRHISYLTLAHIYETLVHINFIGNGAQIGFFGANIRKLTEDFIKLEPTILCGVPRVYQRIYDKVMARAADAACYKRPIFRKYLRESSEAVRQGRRKPAQDNKVWIPIRRLVGLEKVRLCVTGAAPIAPYLLEFLKVVIDCKVLQGYGLTETAAALAITLPDDLTIGHCGPPLPSVEVKLVDVSEMAYKHTDTPCPRGEVWVRGPSVFSGYYKNEKATQESFPDNDGWFATGDIGRWNPNGTLSIIDRRKNIFKLSQGEYIAAERIEGLYARAESVGQIWVYGNSYKAFVVGVVVPSAEWLIIQGQKQGIWKHAKGSFTLGTPKFSELFAEMCTKHKDAVYKLVLDNIRLQEGSLKGFEKVKDIIIESDIDELLQGFNVGKDLLTPSFKLKRPKLLKKYVSDLKELYKKNGAAAMPDEKWGGE